MNAKRILRLLAILIVISLPNLSLQAQLKPSSSAIGAKVLLLDFGIPNSITDLRTTNGIEVFYRYNLNDKFAVNVPLKVGVAHFNDEINNKNIFMLDATLAYKVGDQTKKILPYVFAGGGALLEDETDILVQVPVGVGVNLRLTENAFLNVQGEYRLAMEDFRNNVNLGIGIMYQLSKGSPDTDKDGIVDIEDACPTEPGTIEARGCPDADADGVPDSQDECPLEAGTIALVGCPDKDNDGVADKDDACPDVAGSATLNGCPDSDGDGVGDAEDNCPDEAGTKENNGCPVTDSDGDGVLDDEDNCPEEVGTAATQGCPDTDGDGVADADDRCPDLPGDFGGCPDTDGDGIIDSDDSCPDQPGLISSKGCPELNDEDRRLLNLATRAVQFETGRAALKPESNQVLQQIKDIMDRYPAYNLTISGYTDNVGDEDTNLVLSRERAKSCYTYLVSLGAKPEDITFEGYGEANPLASNRTSQGRRLNRRVEFELSLK